MVYSWDKANANAPSRRTTQYFEMMGSRALYHDGWIACTTPPHPPWKFVPRPNPDVMNSYKWELYDLSNDWTQNNDLAKSHLDKLRELQERFIAEAAKHQIFPLDNAMLTRLLKPRPSLTLGRSLFTYTGELFGLPIWNAPDIVGRSFTFTAEVDIPQGEAEGVLVTAGGRFGGYGFYLLKGKPVFVYNYFDLERFRWEGIEELSPGKHTLMFDFKYDGSGFGKGGLGVLSVDGKPVASLQMPHTIPITLQWNEMFDVAVYTGTFVDDQDYQAPFRFTGRLNKLTVSLQPRELGFLEKMFLFEKGQEPE